MRGATTMTYVTYVEVGRGGSRRCCWVWCEEEDEEVVVCDEEEEEEEVLTRCDDVWVHRRRRAAPLRLATRGSDPTVDSVA